MTLQRFHVAMKDIFRQHMTPKVFLACIYLFVCTIVIAQPFQYPETPKQPVWDTLFGTVIRDDYRWLEDVNTPQVQSWLNEQAGFTEQLLEKIPGKNALIEEYKKLDQINNVAIRFIWKEGGRYFYSKVLKGENVGKLYYRQGKSGKEILLFDPQEYAKGQPSKVTFGFMPSNDGKKVALGLTDKGKLDIYTVKFLDVETRKFYPDSLYPVNSMQMWTPENNGIVYGQLQSTDQLSPEFFKDIPLKLHRLREDVKDDMVVLSRHTNPGLDIKSSDLLYVHYSPDKKYIMLNLPIEGREVNRIYYASAPTLENGKLTWKPLTRARDDVRTAIVYREKVYLLTEKEAPNFKLIAAPLHNFDIATAKTIIPEGDKLIGWLSPCKDYMFLQKTDGINTVIDKLNFSTGEVQTVKLPLNGFTWPQTFNAETNDCVMHVSSWKQPTTRFDYDPVTDKSEINTIFPMLKYPGTDDLIVEEIEVRSHDGTMVPLSLIYNKNVKKDGQNIVFMTGYGSYGGFMIPYFNLAHLPLLNRNVIVAHTHPRGGGEKGPAWHMGGFKSTKPNTWKDFIACGEFLIDKGYTSSKHLIGHGTSAGGIMIGRAMTERPDLFAAAINNVPVSNPLRGENRPNGARDAQEFGTVKDSTEAMGLIEMDAYLHVALT